MRLVCVVSIASAFLFFAVGHSIGCISVRGVFLLLCHSYGCKPVLHLQLANADEFPGAGDPKNRDDDQQVGQRVESSTVCG